MNPKALKVDYLMVSCRKVAVQGEIIFSLKLLGEDLGGSSTCIDH